MCLLLSIAWKQPPWTFVNLFIYAVAWMVDPTTPVLRASYASMWGTLVAFEGIVLFRRDTHKFIMEKQQFGPVAFYAFDIVVHWLPLLLLYVPFEGYLVNACGAAANVLWGVVVTRGTMNLSEMYCPLPMFHWAALWVIVSLTTVLVSF